MTFKEIAEQLKKIDINQSEPFSDIYIKKHE